jgi:hypothetical protein
MKIAWEKIVPCSKLSMEPLRRIFIACIDLSKSDSFFCSSCLLFFPKEMKTYIHELFVRKGLWRLPLQMCRIPLASSGLTKSASELNLTEFCTSDTGHRLSSCELSVLKKSRKFSCTRFESILKVLMRQSILCNQPGLRWQF